MFTAILNRISKVMVAPAGPQNNNAAPFMQALQYLFAILFQWPQVGEVIVCRDCPVKVYGKDWSH